MNRSCRYPMRVCESAVVLAWLAAAGCAPPPPPGRQDDRLGSGTVERQQYELMRSSRAAARAVVWNPRTYDMPQSLEDRTSMRSATWRPEPALGGTASDAGAVLVLYDTTGPWGFAGELYAMATANLVSHFAGWTARPVSAYVCGEAASFRAVAYLGSTYDEPLPTCLLDDVLASSKPVLWSHYNLWKLHARAAATGAPFAARYGFAAETIDNAPVEGVAYRGQTLDRPAYVGEFMRIAVSVPEKARVLAQAVRPGGEAVPWAVQSGNFFFFAENPFTYMSEESRTWVFADVLYEALAPETPERHRAILRLEDIGATHDPAQLRAITDWLHAEGVPFGFSTIPKYTDPRGVYNDGAPYTRRLSRSPVAAELQYAQSRGGVLVMHGHTHQWSTQVNPYTAVSGDDYEFFRVTENADLSLNYQGPVPEDSVAWAGRLMDRGMTELQLARLDTPTIFEFPHYAASPASYQAAGARFATAWDRRLYFTGQLRGGSPDYGVVFGQMFPYVVRDVHGMRVLPENLGNVVVDEFYEYPDRTPAQIVRAAQLQRVVRDNVVGFYFHPFLSLSLLQETVRGIRDAGYTFVSPDTL